MSRDQRGASYCSIYHTYIDPRYQPRSGSSLCKAALSWTESSIVQLYQLHFCSDNIIRQSLRLYFSQVFYRKWRFHHTLLRCIELFKRKLTYHEIYASIVYQILPHHFLFWRWAISMWYGYFNNRIWYSHFLLYLYMRIIFKNTSIERIR